MSIAFAHANDDILERYTWQNRLLLIFAPSADDSQLREQQEELLLQQEENALPLAKQN